MPTRADAAGRVRRADRRAGDPDADGLGHDPRRPSADGRHVRPADQPPLRQRDDARVATSCSASATAGPTATPARSRSTPRAASSCTSTSSRRRSAACSRPTSASSPTPRRRSSCSSRSRARWKAAGKLTDRGDWVARMPRAQAHDAAQDQLRQRADQAAARLPVHEQQPSAATPATSARSACRRSPARSSCTSTSRATGSTAARPARSAGPFRPRSACAPPTRRARSSRCRATTTSSS